MCDGKCELSSQQDGRASSPCEEREAVQGVQPTVIYVDTAHYQHS